MYYNPNNQRAEKTVFWTDDYSEPLPADQQAQLNNSYGFKKVKKREYVKDHVDKFDTEYKQGEASRYKPKRGSRRQALQQNPFLNTGVGPQTATLTQAEVQREPFLRLTRERNENQIRELQRQGVRQRVQRDPRLQRYVQRLRDNVEMQQDIRRRRDERDRINTRLQELQGRIQQINAEERQLYLDGMEPRDPRRLRLGIELRRLQGEEDELRAQLQQVNANDWFGQQ